MQNALRELMPLYGVPIGPPVELATLFDPPLPTVQSIVVSYQPPYPLLM